MFFYIYHNELQPREISNCIAYYLTLKLILSYLILWQSFCASFFFSLTWPVLDRARGYPRRLTITGSLAFVDWWSHDLFRNLRTIQHSSVECELVLLKTKKCWDIIQGYSITELFKGKNL